jgi:SAM-dependent methyltransferase
LTVGAPGGSEFDEFSESIMGSALDSSILVLDFSREKEDEDIDWTLAKFVGKYLSKKEEDIDEEQGKTPSCTWISRPSAVIVLHRLKDESDDCMKMFDNWMDMKERTVIDQCGIGVIGMTSQKSRLGAFPSSFGCRNGPFTREETQFQYIVDRVEMWKDFETWVGTRKRHLGRNRPRYVSTIARSMAVQKKTDSQIYAKLFGIIHGVGVSSTSTGIGSQSIVEHRGALRADYASSWIEKHLIREDRPRESLRVLDFGCAEGANTRSMATTLKLSPDDIHGCDVRDLTGGITPKELGFTFQLLGDTPSGVGFVLPYDSDVFDVISCQMVLHHITHPMEDVMREFCRVLRTGGILILREHDCLKPEHEVFFDVIHGMFSLVLSNPREDPHHIDTFFAHYRPRSEWMRIAETNGFQCKTREKCVNSDWWNVWRAYYDVFVAL